MPGRRGGGGGVLKVLGMDKKGKKYKKKKNKVEPKPDHICTIADFVEPKLESNGSLR